MSSADSLSSRVRTLATVVTLGTVACAPFSARSRSHGIVRVDAAEVRVPQSATGTNPAAPLVLHVVVRDLIEPGRPIEGAEVSVRRAGMAPPWSVRGRLTGADGRVESDTLTAGDYDVAIRRVGYAALITRVRIRANCPTWLELYLTSVSCDIGDCPALPPPRATITTCDGRT